MLFRSEGTAPVTPQDKAERQSAEPEIVWVTGIPPTTHRKVTGGETAAVSTQLTVFLVTSGAPSTGLAEPLPALWGGRTLGHIRTRVLHPGWPGLMSVQNSPIGLRLPPP